jgi:hypothetical protein
MPEKKDFIIKDKRIFSEETQDEKGTQEQPEPVEKEDEVPETEEAIVSEEAEEDVQLPEINFATFVFSLNSSVLVHFGVINDPATGKKVKNLSLAKQTIDILGMLEEKTQGNLTVDEESMLKNILYDLRMIYVKEKG